MVHACFHRLPHLLPAIALGLCLGSPSALAGPLADAAVEAETLASGGKALAAHARMQEALADFAATLPLSIGLAEFTTDKPAAYGSYTPRSGTVFKSGEPLITYLELVGLSWKALPDKRYSSAFTVDLELIDYKGDTLAAQKKFGSFSFTGRIRNQEIYTHLTLDVTGAPPGDYKVRYTVNDAVGERSTSFEQKFSIAKE